jgi:hypothetical protein
VTLARLLCATAIVFAASGCSDEQEDADSDEMLASAEAYTQQTIRAEVDRRVGRCFTHDFSADPFVALVDPKYVPDGPLVTRWASELIEAKFELGEHVGRLLFRTSEGAAIVDDVAARLGRQATEQHLSAHQTVLSAQCVSANLIRYSTTGLGRLMGSTMAVDIEAGVCSEFSLVLARILNRLGIDADLQVSQRERHAWVDVSLRPQENAWYYVEPQLDPTRTATAFLNRH